MCDSDTVTKCQLAIQNLMEVNNALNSELTDLPSWFYDKLTTVAFYSEALRDMALCSVVVSYEDDEPETAEAESEEFLPPSYVYMAAKSKNKI